jgi:hypothetical protein
MFILKYFFLLITLLATLGFSRPPRDMIIMPPAREKGVRVIRNKHITFTNEQPDQIVKQQILTLYSVKGRSRPDRSGRVLSLIDAKSIVNPFKWSKDKKWVGVTVKKSGIRVWIPKSAVPPLGPDFKKIGSTKKSKSRKSDNQESSPSSDEADTEDQAAEE